MLDGKAYLTHFPDDPAYDTKHRSKAPARPDSAALREALAALESEFRSILKAAAATE
jgi:hypothetical protein